MSDTGRDSGAPHGAPNGTPGKSNAVTRTETGSTDGGGARRETSTLAPGSVLGPYRIAAVIGRGGMGVVYEAEELDSGRRVALKVLSPDFQREIDRARFLREGRLAASLNHPHCVYVFGAWEFEGRLAIAMELMRETLADRVRREGPLPVATAVDAILDAIAGLEAAAANGILHRDIKPSNCFVDEHGRVKIGDFGISISAHATTQTGLVTGRRIVGTPGYASPEQLRADPVDARTDIYGVGATLYELLTGRPPLVKPDLMSLLTAVATEMPRAPQLLNRAIPHGLGQSVLRCLAKQPERRFASYPALTAALRIYSSSVPAAAPLGRRGVAALIDHFILFTTFLWVITITLGSDMDSTREAVMFAAIAFVWRFVYFAATESIWGASIGKALSGIRVATPAGHPAGVGRIVCRSFLFVFSFDAIPLITAIAAPQWLFPLPGGVPGFLLRLDVRVAIALGILFCTARRGNGFAGAHERLTGTRVLDRRAPARPSSIPTMPDARPSAAIARVGPYDVLAPSIDGMPPGWSLGFDPVLTRPIWIRSTSAEALTVSAARRAVNRPARLRWLAGRRDTAEAWDAYSAAPGLSLLDACRTRRPWAEVRWWLLSLAQECRTARRESAVPRLSLERVRVVVGGWASVVDDPPHDASVDPPLDPPLDAPLDDGAGSLHSGDAVTSAAFLSSVAHVSLGRDAIEPTPARAGAPLPVGAARLLRALGRSSPMDDEQIVSSLERLAVQPAATTWQLRLLPIALCLLPAVVSGFNSGRGYLVSDPAMRSPDARVAAACLRTLDLAERGEAVVATELRDALQVLLASRYRRFMERPQGFQFSGLDLDLHGNYTALRQWVLRDVPNVDAARRAAAENAAASFIEDVLRQPARFSPWVIPYFQVGVLWFTAIIGVGVSLVFRGGLLRMAGLEVVGHDGEPASRVRLVVRSLLMWSPILIAGLIQASTISVSVVPGVASFAAIVVMSLGTLLSLASPSRGIHDRLTGTWVVPR